MEMDMNIEVSVDKMIFELTEIPRVFFLKEAMSLQSDCGVRWDSACNDYFLRRIAYCEKLTFDVDSKYLCMLYQNFNEPISQCYTLRVETHPDYLPIFLTYLKPFLERAKEVRFVWCDVAYDVPIHLDNIFVMSKDNRRKPNLEQGTIYFGHSGQRKSDAYCRIYDKRKELQRQGIITNGELTRIEIGYKPVILMSQILQNPPDHNNDYVVWVINEWDNIEPLLVDRIRKLRIGENYYTQYIRSKVRNSLSEYKLDLSSLAKKAWTSTMWSCFPITSSYTCIRSLEYSESRSSKI
jgi:hypothetical protein